MILAAFIYSLCKNIGIICQIVLASASVVTLYISARNHAQSTSVNEKRNAIEVSNTIYELILKCTRINNNMEGNLTFYIIKKELWNTIDDTLKKITPLPNSSEEITDTLVYHNDENDSNDLNKDIRLEEKEKNAYEILNNYLNENILSVSKMRNDQNQTAWFDEELISLDICMISRLSQYDDLKSLLDEYISKLETYRNECKNAVNEKNKLNYLKKIAEMINPECNENYGVNEDYGVFEFFKPMDITVITKSKETLIIDEKRIQNELNKYINELINENIIKLDNAKADVIKAYEDLKNGIKLILSEDSKYKRKKKE